MSLFRATLVRVLSERWFICGLVGLTAVDIRPVMGLPLMDGSSNSASAIKRELLFEANEGQTRPEVKFLARTSGYTLSLEQSGAKLAFKKGKRRVAMNFLGANSKAIVTGVLPSQAKINYFSGVEPGSWIRNVRTYERVKYTSLYKNTDLIFYGTEGNLEYDFVVKPGADPNQIAIGFDVGLIPSISADGDLLVSDGDRQLRFHAPLLYQIPNSDSVRTETSSTVYGKYSLNRDNTIGFAISHYDHTKTLVIDPVVSYSSYLGGTDDEGIFGIQHDRERNIYVAGETSSLDFPSRHPVQANEGGDYDVFVSKLDPTGKHLIYSTYLGGSDYDHAVGLAVNEQGDAYVAGVTKSVNFPTRKAVQGAFKGIQDAFIARLTHDGSDLVFSTYLGGSQFTGAEDITIDLHSNAYITGETNSPDLPVSAGALQTQCDGPNGFSPSSCNVDAFVTKIAADGSKLLYSTFLGGSSYDGASGIAVDRAGAAYITGQSASVDYPVLRPYQSKLAGSSNAFVSKLSPSGNKLDFSTYIGGSIADTGTALAIGQDGDVYITGMTASLDFPLVKPFQTNNRGGYTDCFVAELSREGSELLRSSYFGGSGWDYPYKLGVDVFGSVSVIGFTTSNDLFTLNALQSKFGGGYSDAFVLKLLPETFSPLYATYLGGIGDEFGYGIHAEEFGSVWIGGSTSSHNFPMRRGFQSAYAGGPFDAFLTNLNLTVPDYFRILEDLLAGDSIFRRAASEQQLSISRGHTSGASNADTLAKLEQLESTLARASGQGDFTESQLQRALMVLHVLRELIK